MAGPAPILLFFGATVGLVILIVATVLLIVPLFRAIGWCFKAIGWLIAHIAKFIGRTFSDALRALGATITAIIFLPLILINIVIGRWSAAGHFARALTDEASSVGRALYRLFIGNPARLLLMEGALEGIEQRVPNAIAHAPGADKPSRRTGQFPGYTIVGSLKGGGSGGRLFIAEPSPEKRAAYARAGAQEVDRVVIKSFSVEDGSTLAQIIRESRALEAARKLNLILDHELSDERFFYVTPYVPGIDLTTETQRLHSRSSPQGLDPEPLQAALSYIGDLLVTLDRYHTGGLWHKDIKPDNIIVADGEAHLVDLGLVTPLRSAMTLTTHGTEYFRDPELVRLALRGVKVHEVDGVKFDLYGVGAVLYSMLENSFPAHAGLSRITKRCPEALRWIVRRAMADIHQRYASSREMLADLRVVAQAKDPFALRPADLPSMKGGISEDDLPRGDHRDMPQSADPVSSFSPGAPGTSGFAGSPGYAAHTPRPAPQPSPAKPGAAPRVGKTRPKLIVADWWTGKYRADQLQRPNRPEPVHPSEVVMPTSPRSPRTPRPPRMGIPKARPHMGHGAAHRPAAKEQLHSARARVREMRTRAQQRIHRTSGKRLRTSERAGIGIAVVALLLVVMLPLVLRTSRPTHVVMSQPYTFRIHPIAMPDSRGHQVLRADFPAEADTISGHIRQLLFDPSPEAGMVLVLDGNAAPPSEFIRAVTGDLGRPVVYASSQNTGDYVSDAFVAEALAILGVNRDPDVDTTNRLIELLRGTSDPRITDLIWYSDSTGGPLLQQYGSTEPATIHLVTLRDLRGNELMQPIYAPSEAVDPQSSRVNAIRSATRAIRASVRSEYGDR